MKPQIISKEIVKPSSPTPSHLSCYQLSFLDQISPPVYNPLILFYPTNERETKLSDNLKLSKQLKQSLSQALTDYYPLAGRVRDNSFVDCNDEGIPFVEAEVINCKLSQVIEHPEPDELRKLLPFELDQAKELAAGVQFNIFACGGFAVGVCISHKLGDALATFTFINFWAAVSRGESGLVPPQFISATLFPPKNLSGYNPRIGITKENIATKRLVFSTSAIEAIRAKYGKGAGLDNQRPPSRIEALTVFIWSRFMAATSAESTPARKLNLILHAVNLRARMDPPLPDHSFGNYYRIAITVPFPGEDGSLITSKMRESVSSIDEEYVQQLQDGEDYLNFLNEEAEKFTKGEVEYLNFTSVCRFPLYEADFGWGKPIWVGSPSLTFGNLVVFIETASRDGIEALIHLKKEDMARFQEDKELLQFAAP
uniref:Uncharacterized protein MANES_13G013800 n=1 Tax=Rhizophora mucronata TaxID=61149 RepID=A0A2P2MD48_RHIMU